MRATDDARPSREFDDCDRQASALRVWPAGGPVRASGLGRWRRVGSDCWVARVAHVSLALCEAVFYFLLGAFVMGTRDVEIRNLRYD